VETRSLVFLAIMIALGAAALVAFVVFLISKLRHSSLAAAETADAAPTEAALAAASPPAIRLLGLLGLLAAFLILAWTFLSASARYAVMLYLVYPASLATALVLLFDKATRSWSYKSGIAAVREWFFCDAIVFLLFLAFLNLWLSGAGDAYRSLFWDVLGLVLMFLVFWLLDRKFTPYRFLVAYGYLVLLPILLLIWSAVQDVPARLGVDQPPPPVAEAASEPSPEAAGGEPAVQNAESARQEGTAEEPSVSAEAPEPQSWWESIWPFFSWAAAFFVLEIIGLIASAESERSLILLLKDAVFFVGYAVLLLVAAA
jgi:hypothetical protein